MFVATELSCSEDFFILVSKVVREFFTPMVFRRFYLPHGITVDFENNVWVTDVAMHQVLKFPSLLDPKRNNTEPLLTLGNKLKPGSDWTSFCQPTAVAVLSSGEFFVSDGYCNARIIKYSRDGNMILHWGRPSLTAGG